MAEKQSKDAVIDIDKTKVDIAARFLRNSNVRETEKENQETFLKNKGLSQPEIDLAFQTASEMKDEDDDGTSWSIFDYLKGIVLGTGILSAANYAYKAYVLPYATRELKDDVRMESLLESFQSIKDDIKQHTYELTGTLKQMQVLMEENQKSLNNINKALKKDAMDVTTATDLKSELSLIKGMMLSKDQFRATPYTAVNQQKVNEIPAWQQIAEEFNAVKAAEESRIGVKNKNLSEVEDSRSSKDVTSSDIAIESNIEVQMEEASTASVISEVEIINNENSLSDEGKTDDVDSVDNVKEEMSCSVPASLSEQGGNVTVASELNGLYEIIPSCEQLPLEPHEVNISQTEGVLDDSGLKSSNTSCVISELDHTEDLLRDVVSLDGIKNGNISSSEEQMEIADVTLSDEMLPEDTIAH